MRLATYERNGVESWGLILRHPRDAADWIFNPTALLEATAKLPACKGGGFTWWRPDFVPPGGNWPRTLVGVFAEGTAALESLRRMQAFLMGYLEQGDSFLLTNAGWPMGAVTLRAPIREPRLLLGVVGNNAGFLRMDPARARNLDQPSCHQRTQTSVVGPGEPILLPAGAESFSGTTELGVVIGRGGRDIPQERVREHIAGFTVVNDGLGSLYAQRWAGFDRAAGPREPHFHAANTASWLDKKSDCMLAMGPWIVTPDEVGDPYDLLCWYRENGVVRNRAHCGAMVCGIEETIHWLSQFLTLEPGMVLHFGALGQDGMPAAPCATWTVDHAVECEIERIGVLRNPLRIDHSPLAAQASPPAAPIPAERTPVLTWQPSHVRHFWTLLANTRAAAERTHIVPRSYPLAYNNPPTALAASGTMVLLPESARTVNATCELAAVVGRKAKNIPPDAVRDHLLGCVAMIALRDSSFADRLVQPHPLPANMPEIYARWPDRFNACSDLAPFPPPPGALGMHIECGTAQAGSSTADYLLDASAVVAELSRGITLLPGDIVTLGESAATITLPPAGQLPRDTIVCAAIDGVGSVSISLRDDRTIRPSAA